MSALNLVNKSYWLEKICESNYRKLLSLVPDLDDLNESKSAVANAEGKPTLYLRLIQRAPYTLTLELTHRFQQELEAFEPAVQIRVYLDVKAAEVLSDYHRPLVADALKAGSSGQKVLDYKWSLNYFLDKWLDHCLQNRYRFSITRPSQEHCLALD